MKSTKISQFNAAIVLTIIGLLFFAVYAIMSITLDVNKMQDAANNYEYYRYYIYLLDQIAWIAFVIIYLLMIYLTYIKKQFSKWCMWLFYLMGFFTLIYYSYAGFLIEDVFSLVEREYFDKLHSLANSLYYGPVPLICCSYLFVPKILKDAQKLKEEQKLTV